MNSEEIKKKIALLRGQGNQVDLAGVLADVLEAINDTPAPPKPLIVTEISSTQEYSRHEMAMHLGITEDQLMQVLRGEIAVVTDELFTLHLSYNYHDTSFYEAVFGGLSKEYGEIAKFTGDTDSNTYTVDYVEI